MRFQAPRGTKDVLMADGHRWVRLETTFREVGRLFGYAEVRTPTFEDTAVFTRTAGETSDIVTKEMYTFLDKGGRSITLKPEGTAPVIRAVLEHNLLHTGTPLRLCYLTPFFRYERPQMGRLREAHQGGFELIATSSPVADAEIIEVTVAFFRALGLSDTVVRLNSLGTAECRAKYRDALLAYAKPYVEAQDEAGRARILRNPLRLMDSKDPDAITLMKSAPSIQTYLSDESVHHFNQVCARLDLAGITFEVVPEIVRGLDYYSHTVFEIHSTLLGAQGALCGGGRYDDLVADLGGPPTSCVGVGIGFERALLVLEQARLMPSPDRLDLYVVVASPEGEGSADNLTRSCRDAGLSVVRDVDGRPVKGQFKQADRSGARLVAILGDEELAKNEVQVKDLATGEQSPIPLLGASETLRRRLLGP